MNASHAVIALQARRRRTGSSCATPARSARGPRYGRSRALSSTGRRSRSGSRRRRRRTSRGPRRRVPSRRSARGLGVCVPHVIIRVAWCVYAAQVVAGVKTKRFVIAARSTPPAQRRRARPPTPARPPAHPARGSRRAARRWWAASMRTTCSSRARSGASSCRRRRRRTSSSQGGRARWCGARVATRETKNVARRRPSEARAAALAAAASTPARSLARLLAWTRCSRRAAVPAPRTRAYRRRRLDLRRPHVRFVDADD